MNRFRCWSVLDSRMSKKNESSEEDKTPDFRMRLQETYMSSDTLYWQFKESKRAVNSISRLVEEDDDEDVEKVSWSGEPVGSESVSPDSRWRILLRDYLQSLHSPPVYSGISWSVRETEVSNQRTEREAAPPKGAATPSISKSNSGYSLSSLFKGETDSHHMNPETRGPVVIKSRD